MGAGKYKHRITIQSCTQTENEIKEKVKTWSDFATVWALVEPATGKLYFTAKQLDSKVDGRIIMRYRTGILPTMRAVFEGRALDFVSLITVKEAKREIHIMYTEALD